MKVVIDVNVWVSGLLWGGPPGEVLQLAHSGEITSCISAELLLELKVTLGREKFSNRLGLRNLTPDGVVAIAQAVSSRVTIAKTSIPELRDPADLKIAATAMAAEASYLITGDQDLLALQRIRCVRVITPNDFLTQFSK